ncbi:DUF302 domain-containing protein [uncultured Thiothrix sp.]|uniref:DUF302 domain-containing protein n=1 Tax=uncultured Thiothrix sp. TaxID=223185 RepID=UPI0026041F42|nr:DUF302 domain-containing protein [uncultured Thiothrix sp.]
MNFIRNMLALIGVLAVLGAAVAYFKYGNLFMQISSMAAEQEALAQLDPKAKEIYLKMWKKLKETGNSAEATIVKYPLADGVSPADAEQSMKMVANEHNIKAVGELPLSEQVKLETGQDQRFLKIFQFCNPQTAMRMVDYSDAYSAYLPCRIAMVQDKQGKYYLYSLDMDIMLHGGKTLPPELFVEAKKVQAIITDIMQRGAAGDF